LANEEETRKQDEVLLALQRDLQAARYADSAIVCGSVRWTYTELERIRLGTVEYAVALCNSGAVQRLPGAPRSAESFLSRIGPITLGMKQAGERSARNSPATFDVAGAGNVTMAAGLWTTAKAVDLPTGA
jgi:hypothetical protein